MQPSNSEIRLSVIVHCGAISTIGSQISKLLWNFLPNSPTPKRVRRLMCCCHRRALSRPRRSNPTPEASGALRGPERTASPYLSDHPLEKGTTRPEPRRWTNLTFKARSKARSVCRLIGRLYHLPAGSRPQPMHLDP